LFFTIYIKKPILSKKLIEKYVGKSQILFWSGPDSAHPFWSGPKLSGPANNGEKLFIVHVNSGE
jgi:hypothetical protein